MTRFNAILLIFVIFFVAFAGYFGYREWTDPILFPGGDQVQSAAVETEEEAASRPSNMTDATVPQPEPARDPNKSISSVNPEEIETLVDETLTQQVGQLAALVEARFAYSMESVEDRITEQSEKLELADQVIRETLTTYQENTRLSVQELSDTLNLISEMRNESEDITSGLENARAAWDQLFDDVTAIDDRSDDRLAEANFEFQTYEIVGAETLSEISRRLEADYNLPESDLSFLLNRFNDIEYRLHDPGGRRPSYRVIINNSLRVPIPKTAGTILNDYALPEKLRSQIAHINQATSANTNLRKNLSRQVDKLKGLEANVQAIASMSETLKQIDLSTDGPFPDKTDLSPPQQEAWQQFENAVTNYRSASGFEEEKLAKEKLQQSISRILKQYEQDYLNTSETETNPYDFYIRFIEKYRPANSG